MQRRFHIPSQIEFSGTLSDAEKDRLEQAVVAAVRRAVEETTANRTGFAIIDNTPPPRERLNPERLQDGTYAVPSYDNGGESEDVPVQTVTFEEEEVEPVTSTLPLHPAGEVSEDRVIEEESPFEDQLIAIFPGFEDVRVRSERYAVSSHLTRAVRWGQYLFGARSFVIIEGPFAQPDSRYYVLGTNRAITGQQPPPGTTRQVTGGRVWGIGGETHWQTEFHDDQDQQYIFRVLFTKDDQQIFPPNIRLAEEYYTQMAVARRERREIPGEMARSLVFDEIDQFIEQDQIEAAARRLARLDAHAFGLVDWETKSRYLQVLTNAWTREPQERAVVEIMKSVESRTELDAVLRMLRQTGIFEQVFDDLDSQLWSLLVTVGERFGRSEPITLDFLLEIMQAAGLDVGNITAGPTGISIGPDTLAEAEEAARSFIRFLSGSLEGIWMLISEPDKVVQGVAQLVRLIIMANLAAHGYPPAVEYMDRILQQMSQQVVYGYRGARVLGVSGQVVRRIKWAIIWEVASSFIGVGEVKAILSGVGISERVASVARLARMLEAAGGFADAGRVASKLNDVTRLLTRTSILSTHDDVLRLISYLPEEDVVRLARRLESAEVDDIEDMAQLANRYPEIAEAANHALRRAEALGVLETRVGRLSDNLQEGFRRIARESGFSNARLFNLMSAVPGENAELFMRVIRVMPDTAFGSRVGGRSLGFFQNLATHPRSMNFLLDAGYETFSSIYRYARYDIARFEEYLDALSDIARNMPAQQFDIAYRRFLDRLRDEDAGAFQRLRDALNARRRASGQGTLRSYTQQEIDEIVEETSDIQEIRELAGQMDNNSSGMLFERWVHRYVFGRQLQVPQTRLAVRQADNAHIDLFRDRSSDFFLEDDGSLWDAKIYQSGSEIDVWQLEDYYQMEVADFVVTGNNQRVSVESVNYIFSNRAAAETNRSLLHVQAGAEAWYIDDAGMLHHLP